MAGLISDDPDHWGRLAITLLVLIVWLTVLLFRPSEAALVNGLAGITIGHYYGKGGSG